MFVTGICDFWTSLVDVLFHSSFDHQSPWQDGWIVPFNWLHPWLKLSMLHQRSSWQSSVHNVQQMLGYSYYNLCSYDLVSKRSRVLDDSTTVCYECHFVKFCYICWDNSRVHILLVNFQWHSKHCRNQGSFSPIAEISNQHLLASPLAK